MEYTEPQKHPSTGRMLSLSELNADVGGGTRYGDWLGIGGPGKLFKDILKHEQSERDTESD